MPRNPRYSVVKELGAGAMGRVLLAEDRDLGRRVAIKVLSPTHLANPEVRQRFSREARIQAMAEHPNVVEIYDQDLAAPEPYLVMELVEGEELGSRLRSRGRLPLAEVLSLAREVGGALDHLHARNVLHRDLKPSNLMIRDRDGSAVVMDLGLASQRDVTVLTRTGSMIGTPYYFPPEVVLGQRWTPASDQYQLALILFEALCGERWVLGTTMDEVLTSITTPRRRAFPEDLPELSETRRRVLARAAHPDPSRRFPNCAAFADALEADTLAEAPEDDPVAASGGFDPLGASGPEPGATSRGPRRMALVLVPLFLAAFLAGAFLWPPGAPDEVRWQVIGDSLRVSYRDAGLQGVRLHLGGRELSPLAAPRAGRRWIVARDLPERGVEAWLSWPGGAGARAVVEPGRPALRRAVVLGEDHGLTVEVVRPVRARVLPTGVELPEAVPEDHPEDGPFASAPLLDPGAHRLDAPGEGPWVLAWEEEGLVSTRALDLAAVVEDSVDRLRHHLGEMDPDAVLLSRSRSQAWEGEGFRAERALWVPVAEWLPRAMGAPVPPETLLWIWTRLELWARSVAQERALGVDAADLPVPSDGPGARRIVPELPGGDAAVVDLAFEPLGGFDHETRSHWALTTEASQAVRSTRFLEAAVGLRFPWPERPAGARGDPWFVVGLGSFSRLEQIRVRAADEPIDRPPETLRFHLWYPSPTVRRDEKANGWYMVRLPEALLPAPGTPMVLEAASLLNPSALRISVVAGRLLWPRGEAP